MSPHPGRTGASFQTAGCCDSAPNSPWKHQNRPPPHHLAPQTPSSIHRGLNPWRRVPNTARPAPGSHLLTVSAQTREWVISVPQGLAGLSWAQPGTESWGQCSHSSVTLFTTESARPHLQHRTSTITTLLTAVPNVASITPLQKKKMGISGKPPMA